MFAAVMWLRTNFMDERRTARIVGLSLGGIFAAVLVLNALTGL
jgi:hypothetical protein